MHNPLMQTRFGDDNWHFNFDLMLLRLRDKEFEIKWRFRNPQSPKQGPFPPGLVSLQFRIKMWEARKLDWAFNIQAGALGVLARMEAGLPPIPDVTVGGELTRRKLYGGLPPRESRGTSPWL